MSLHMHALQTSSLNCSSHFHALQYLIVNQVPANLKIMFEELFVQLKGIYKQTSWAAVNCKLVLESIPHLRGSVR